MTETATQLTASDDDEQAALERLSASSPVLQILIALNQSDLSRREIRLAMYILARTFHADGTVEPAFIPLKEFWHPTRLTASHVCDVRERLIRKNIISVTYPGTGKLPFYAIVPGPTDWLIWDDDQAESTPEQGQPDHG